MTHHTGTLSTVTHPLLMTGGGILALALLTGCSVSDPESSGSDGSTAATAESSASVAESSPASSGGASASSAASESSSAASSSAASTSSDDPVFSAIDALLAEHSDAVIVQIDRDDDDTVSEIEAVLGDRVMDFEVRDDGTVREDDDEDDDDDDVRRAQEATVTAEDAARAALEGRDGQSIDGMELDEDNGTLRWEVSLDREGGDDGDELHVDAASGTVTQDD